MVRENFENELESEMAQMRSARSVFFMRTQMSQISNEIFEMTERLNVASIDIDRDETPLRQADQAKRKDAKKSAELKARIWALESVLSNIDVLRASTEENRLEMGRLRQRLTAVRQELDDAPLAPPAAAPSAVAGQQRASAGKPADEDRARRLSRDVTSVEKSVYGLAVASSVFSEQTMQRRSHQLALARIASIALYVSDGAWAWSPNWRTRRTMRMTETSTGR